MQRFAELWEKLGVRGQVINIRGRTDREKTAIEGALKIGLPIDFVTVDRHPKSGAEGCFESHQLVCKNALSSGQKIVLVLEDDFAPTDELLTDQGYSALKEAVDFVKNPSSEWNIVYLGVLPNIWYEKSVRTGKHMYKIKPWSCTHAMILNEEYMKKVVSWKFSHTGKDAYDWRHRKCENAYAFHPQAFKQLESPSDVGHFQMNVSGSIRDLPVNFASWYALNIGVSLGHSLCVFAAIAATMSVTSSDMQNAKLAKNRLLLGLSGIK